MGSLIRPGDVDHLFRQLGARPGALTLSKQVVPDPSPTRKIHTAACSQSSLNQADDTAPRAFEDHSALVSVFELLRTGASS